LHTPGDRSLLLFNYCFLVSLPGVVGAGAGVGLVLLPELPPDMPPEVLPPVELLPLAPAPAPARLSCRHLSRSVPVKLMHLAGTSVDAPVDALPDVPAPTLEPDVPLAPVLPDVEPEDCANAAEDRARSAAAVAAVRVFSIIRESPEG
jgi:hypothetical protein